MTAVLIDSNVLVYGYDPGDVVKQQRALETIDSLVVGEGWTPVLSVQCLTELYNTVRRKLSPALSHEVATQEIMQLMNTCTVLSLTVDAVLEACRATHQYQMSFWDALIWAVAKLNQVPIILTEDGQHDRVIEGVRYLNPFDPDFDFAALSV